MIVSVGEVSAKCPACGKAEFSQLLAGPLRLASVLVCDGCKTSSTYRELRDQLGDEAVRQVKASVDALKKRTSRVRRSRKPPRK